MKKIIIYYGPKNEFEKILPSDNRKTLSEFISKDDAKRREFSFDKSQLNKDNEDTEDFEYIENIIAYSESYAGITEGAIQRFSDLFEMYQIDNLYLQNPPLQIQTRLEQTFYSIIHKEYYDYNAINVNHLKELNRTFSDKIIGQESVKRKLLTSFYPLVKGTNDKRPVVLLFYGPSGVGKTETAKFISNLLRQELFRRQFSMYHSNEFADYMFGGNHFQNSFAKELLERKSNVILLDEFDKAAPVFYSAFYQLFDEGIFEDKNYKVKVENAIIICTSNYLNLEDIRKHLGDPIYYRIGNFIEYKPLTQQAKIDIIKLLMSTKYNKLNNDEKLLIDTSDLENLLIKNLKILKNVRHISTLIDDYLYSNLVMKLIDT